MLVIPERLIAILSPPTSVVEVHPEKLVDEFSTAVDRAGFVPAPTMLTDGNPPPSADLKTSIVTDPLGEPISFHPSNVPEYGILT